MPTDPSLQLDTFLPYRLSVVSNALSEAIAQVYRSSSGLSVTEWRLLAVLAQQHEQSAQTLARQTRLDKVSISRALKRLLAAGLVQRRVDGADRRRLPLTLSASGRALYAQIAPKVIARERELMAALDEPARAQLHGLLDQLEAQFQPAGKSA